MELKGKKILIISPELWGTNYLSKHHYAIALRSQVNKVFFLNPPGDINEVEVIISDLKSINYRQQYLGINYLPKFLKNVFSRFEAYRINKLCQVDSWDIVWSFDPFRFQNLDVFQAEIKIFHAVDRHVTILDLELARNSDFTFTTSRLIGKKYEKFTDQLHMINHGLAEYFLGEVDSSVIVRKEGRINVGYIGNLCLTHLDTTTMLTIIEENPNVHFHFWGPFEESNLGKDSGNEGFIQTIKYSSNCTLYGSRPSEQLPGLLNQMDAFLMVYEGDREKVALSNPHKTLEYLSTGKVVITQYIDEYKDCKDLLAMVETNSVLPKKFKEVINSLNYWNNAELAVQRKKLAANNTYPIQLERIEEILN